MPMPMKLVPIGATFGFLTVIEHLSEGRYRWRCLCVCGESCDRSGTDLRTNGDRQSCGCKRRESQALGKTTHGMSGTPEHRAWKNVINRCENPRSDHWEWYGGKGIKVCARWRHSFENFYADMGPRPSDEHSIERVDTDKNYGPENCIWATTSVQSRNRSDNHVITFDGRTQVLQDWAAETKISRTVIRKRLNRGWPVGRALTEPVQFSPRWHGKRAS